MLKKSLIVVIIILTILIISGVFIILKARYFDLEQNEKILIGDMEDLETNGEPEQENMQGVSDAEKNEDKQETLNIEQTEKAITTNAQTKEQKTNISNNNDVSTPKTGNTEDKTSVASNQPKQEENKPSTPIATDENKDNLKQKQDRLIAQFKADINSAAKNNPELWGENGKQLYKIQVASSLDNFLSILGRTSTDYFQPYTYQRATAKVDGASSCTFVIFVDAEKERFYIGITGF